MNLHEMLAQATEDLTRNDLLNILAREVAARQKAEQERDAYREGIEFVLDGFGLDAPCYAEDPENPVEPQDRWITDHLRGLLGLKRSEPTEEQAS